MKEITRKVAERLKWNEADCQVSLGGLRFRNLLRLVRVEELGGGSSMLGAVTGMGRIVKEICR